MGAGAPQCGRVLRYAGLTLVLSALCLAGALLPPTLWHTPPPAAGVGPGASLADAPLSPLDAFGGAEELEGGAGELSTVVEAARHAFRAAQRRRVQLQPSPAPSWSSGWLVPSPSPSPWYGPSPAWYPQSGGGGGVADCTVNAVEDLLLGGGGGVWADAAGAFARPAGARARRRDGCARRGRR